MTEHVEWNSIKNIEILRTRERGPWTYPVSGLELALIDAGFGSIEAGRSNFFRYAGKLMARLGLVRSLVAKRQHKYFAVLMGPAEYRLFPYSYRSEPIVYCFDCWPRHYHRWEKIFRRNRIGLAFFSARQSADYFAARIPEMTSDWIPEAVEIERYSNRKRLEQRRIDILEAGRRYEKFHEAVVDLLRNEGRVHLYENPRGRVIFDSREDLVAGFGESRISICFPGSLTDPARSGDVETVTHRYFESMASGCLIVGKCPVELKDIFGYSPVIEVDWHDPSGQLSDILNSISGYQELVERNYRRLLEVGAWRARAESILDILNRQGNQENQGSLEN